VTLLSLLQDIVEPPWVEQVLLFGVALLGIPFVNSFLTGAIRTLVQATGTNAKTIAYAVAIVMAGVVLLGESPVLPTFDPEAPAQFATAWIALATAWAAFAEGLYQRLLKRWPIFNPA